MGETIVLIILTWQCVCVGVCTQVVCFGAASMLMFLLTTKLS